MVGVIGDALQRPPAFCPYGHTFVAEGVMQRLAVLDYIVYCELARCREDAALRGSAAPLLELSAVSRRIEDRTAALSQLIANELFTRYLRSSMVGRLNVALEEVVTLQETNCLSALVNYVEESATTLSVAHEYVRKRVDQLSGGSATTAQPSPSLREDVQFTQEQCVNESIRYVTDSLMQLNTLWAPMQMEIVHRRCWKTCLPQWKELGYWDQQNVQENVRYQHTRVVCNLNILRKLVKSLT